MFKALCRRRLIVRVKAETEESTLGFTEAQAMHQGRYATNVVLAFAVLACTSAFAAAPPGASLSGELSVTQGGAASYSLPLLTPPGVLEE
ncbi:hypothetical protein D3C85_1388290 [compost metagenome]